MADSNVSAQPRPESPHRPVDPRASFPELEERVLERWRERDVFPSRCAGAQVPLRGVSTRARRPPTGRRARTTCCRACSRTSSPATRRCAATTSSARAAGTATACPSSWRSRLSSGSTSKEDIERYGIAEFNARCREMVLSHVEDWNRLTERIGFWIDLDDAYRTLDHRLHRVGVVGAADDPRARACCTRSSRSSRTAPGAEPRCPATSSASPTSTGTCIDPIGLRPVPGRPSRTAPLQAGDELLSGRPRRGRSSPTPPSPSTPS